MSGSGCGDYDFRRLGENAVLDCASDLGLCYDLVLIVRDAFPDVDNHLTSFAGLDRLGLLPLPR